MSTLLAIFVPSKKPSQCFGEQLLFGEIYTPKPYTYSRPPSQEITWYSPSPKSGSKEDESESNQQQVVLDTLKKLEAELEKTN
ncbi:hypothetical protein DITRI_Ditri08aG0163300 [Diplodiscus trichospermus]